jgi:hypothetical protein
MDWDTAARRQAVTAWQDRHILACWQLMNECADGVQHRFETLVADAGWQGAWLDRGGFAAARLDPPMREEVSRRLPAMLETAGRDLVSIDETFEAIARDLATSRPALPESKEVCAPVDVVIEEEVPPLGGAGKAARSRWSRLGGYVAGAAEAVSSSVRHYSGIDEGLREHARDHIRSVWLDEGDEAATVLGQVEAAIRHAGAMAKEHSR